MSPRLRIPSHRRYLTGVDFRVLPGRPVVVSDHDGLRQAWWGVASQ